MIRERIGLLGGTFDPVHMGHMQLAEAVLKECYLDKVVFIPSAAPPHKKGALITAFHHRLAMLELALKETSKIEYDSIEGELRKPSYTIDTLRVLKERSREKALLYFIVGADAFLEIETWKSYQEIPRLVHMILSPRISFKSARLFEMLSDLGYQRVGNHWRDAEGGKDIYVLRTTPVDLSSSSIRSAIAAGGSVQNLLPKTVVDYINKHALYQIGLTRRV